MNEIGPEGAQHLASALEQNEVTISSTLSYYHSLYIFYTDTYHTLLKS